MTYRTEIWATPWYRYTSTCANCNAEIVVLSDHSTKEQKSKPWQHAVQQICAEAAHDTAEVHIEKDLFHPKAPKEVRYGTTLRSAEPLSEEPVTEADVAFVKELKERPYVPSREAFRNRRTALAEASFSLGLDASAEDILERAEQYEKWLNRTMLEGR